MRCVVVLLADDRVTIALDRGYRPDEIEHERVCLQGIAEEDLIVHAAAELAQPAAVRSRVGPAVDGRHPRAERHQRISAAPAEKPGCADDEHAASDVFARCERVADRQAGRSAPGRPRLAWR